ncbi:hypothetical protein QUG02_02475 [Bacillus hominis]|uniref:HEPN domain-containing protein n=1 Tax=Bacillus hominis TaxID=2817478 RepID=A0ABT7R298_9BACI|nr:hypothetical protein [Bacillus hominis]MDM5191881.1 hypothetical protein [Bacillus hominis]MDM5431612.1 hypothetical protein [Bacillus hominis]MDM5437048.1 hypothetical protein [Bacillus hominis]
MVDQILTYFNINPDYDLKAGSEFGRYRNLEQVKQVAENSAEALEILLKQVEIMK